MIGIQGQPNLLTESLDVAFMVSHQSSLPDSSQVSRRIGTFSRMLFASKTYLNRVGMPRDPIDLEKHACIRFWQATLQKRWELRRGKQRRMVTVSGVCSANSVGLLAQFAREHLGVVILPRFLASHPTFGAGLVRLLPEWEAAPAHVFALTANHLQSARVVKLLETTKAGFAKRLLQLERDQEFA